MRTIHRDNGDVVVKSHSLTPDELTVTGGDVVAVVATDSPDADNEVVVPKNINVDRFRQVRQVYFDHELGQHPIGSAKWIKVDGKGRLISKHFFSQSTELAKAVGDLVKEGIYRSYSIGCMKKTRTLGDPSSAELTSRPDWKGMKIWRGNPLMIEYSVVGQPANKDCVALAVSKKWSRSTVELLTGVTAATHQTANAIVREIKGSPGVPSEREIQKTIARAIDSASKSINTDQVVKLAVARLQPTSGASWRPFLKALDNFTRAQKA